MMKPEKIEHIDFYTEQNASHISGTIEEIAEELLIIRNQHMLARNTKYNEDVTWQHDAVVAFDASAASYEDCMLNVNVIVESHGTREKSEEQYESELENFDLISDKQVLITKLQNDIRKLQDA